MADLRIGKKDNRIKLLIEKEGEDGQVIPKELSFTCSLDDARFLVKVKALMKKLDAVSKNKKQAGRLEETLTAEREAFEALAPGQWDDFLEFLGGDVFDMSQLICLMYSKMQEKQGSKLVAEIVPKVPEGNAV